MTSEIDSSAAPTVQFHGQCNCKSVHFAAEGMPASITNCHCERCRRGTEYPFIAWATFPTNRVQVTLEGKAKDPITISESNIGIRESCTNCGMELCIKYHCHPSSVSVAVRSIQEQDQLPRPIEHIFLADKAVWWQLPEGDALDKWQKFDAPFDKKLEDWRASGSRVRHDLYGISTQEREVS